MHFHSKVTRKMYFAGGSVGEVTSVVNGCADDVKNLTTSLHWHFTDPNVLSVSIVRVAEMDCPNGIDPDDRCNMG